MLLCGRQNIHLRGHRDHGPLLPQSSNSKKENDDASLEEGTSVAKEGNFRALLRFRTDAGDKKLQNHLENSNANATYISPIIQNELIECCKDEIQEVVLDRVIEAGQYSIIFDETTDCSHIEQLSLSFRYLFHGVIREDFVTFANAYKSIRPENIKENDERRLTGIALAHVVEDLLTKYSVDIVECVGIGTDSCSVMSSEVRGAVQELLKKAVNAKWCPCSNHALNNALSKCTNAVPCRNATGIMKKIIVFANMSAKRHLTFKGELGDKALTGLCETWSERHDGHLQFEENLPQVGKALQKISSWEDRKTSADAFCLLQAISTSDFVVSLVCMCNVLGTTKSPSQYLQSPSLDLKKASDLVKDTTQSLETKRQEADERFGQLFAQAEAIANELGFELSQPRKTMHQIHRENPPSDSARTLPKVYLHPLA